MNSHHLTVNQTCSESAQMIFLKVIPQILLRTPFTQLFNHVKYSNEFNLPLFSGLLDHPGMQNTVLASKCLQYKINN